MARVAIIGAGPSGLVSTKYALENGLEPTVFEKEEDIGGVWHPTSGVVWESMHTNLSHFSCMFSDFPWEAPSEDFPSQRQMFDYLGHYANKFELKKHIQFNANVTAVKPVEDRWEVTWSNGNQIITDVFDKLIISTGVFSSAFIPSIPGLKDFQGLTLHSQSYKNPKQFENKTVAVIGSGFSGVEIASDISPVAKEVHHSFTTAHYILPRNIPLKPDPSIQWPIDLLFYNRSTRQQADEIKFKTAQSNRSSHAYMQSVCARQAQLSADLIIPEEKWDHPTHVSISDTYLNDVQNGKIIPKKGSIKHFHSSGLTFEDGTSRSVDAVVFCTGFQASLPFLDESVQRTLEFDPDDQLQPLLLYKCTLHPAFRNLAFVGLYRGPFFGVMELQAKWAAALFANKVSFPERALFDKALAEERQIRVSVPRMQFPHGDYVGLADSIAKELDCLPDPESLKTNNPKLYRQLYEGPVVCAGYRFVECEGLDAVDAFLERRANPPILRAYPPQAVNDTSTADTSQRNTNETRKTF